MTTPNEYVLPYDKYKGKTLGEALALDRAYVEWLAVKMAPRTELGREIKTMAQAVLQTLDDDNQPGPAVTDAEAPSLKSNGADQSRPRIYTEITRSAILHIEDALAIGKVRVFLLSYRRGQGAQATAIHYLDVADARVLAAELAMGHLSQTFVDFKGTANGSQPMSRVLRLEDRGDGQRAPLVLQISNGPGQIVGEGAVKPAGKPTVEIAILLTRWQARRLGHTVLHYLLAWQVAHFPLPHSER